jgi:hypothetical protein
MTQGGAACCGSSAHPHNGTCMACRAPQIPPCALRTAAACCGSMQPAAAQCSLLRLNAACCSSSSLLPAMNSMASHGDSTLRLPWQPAWNDAGRGQPAAAQCAGTRHRMTQGGGSLLRRKESHSMTQGTHEILSCVPCISLHSQFSIFNFQFFIVTSRFRLRTSDLVHGYRYWYHRGKSCFAR